MSLKLYYDFVSQPSRALYILLKKSKLDFKPEYVDLRKGAHHSEEFTKINRMQQVPVINHKGFTLSESVAILAYLSRENMIPDSLYPKDSKQRARVQEFLEWHHVGLRLPCTSYFTVVHMDPILFGRKHTPDSVVDHEKRMINALETLDTKWLRGNSFVAGEDITVADLMAACEIEQPRMTGYDPMANFANIPQWLTKVRSYFDPYYAEAHVILNKIAKKTQAKINVKT